MAENNPTAPSPPNIAGSAPDSSPGSGAGSGPDSESRLASAPISGQGSDGRPAAAAGSGPAPEAPLLEVRGFSLGFGTGSYLPVKDLSLTLSRGEALGLVGESGSGKSLAAFGIMGILPCGAKARGGEILFAGENLLRLGPKERRSLCGERMGMIFQEPLSALNPVLTIGEQVAEIFRCRLGESRKEAKARAIDLLGRVGLPSPASAYSSYPHRFSGGMRQRVVIAMALALSPDLVIADEPTTALDPTIALQIIRLLKGLAAEERSSVLFITHNLRLLKGLAKRVLVMYAGIILEETAAGLENPLHPYTMGLVGALPPSPSEKNPKPMAAIPGSAPNPGDSLPGCPFAPRCPERFAPCEKSLPDLLLQPSGARVRCFGRQPC